MLDAFAINFRRSVLFAHPLDNDDCGDAAQIEVSSVVSGTTLTASVPVQISLLFQKDVRAKSLGYRM